MVAFVILQLSRLTALSPQYPASAIHLRWVEAASGDPQQQGKHRRTLCTQRSWTVLIPGVHKHTMQHAPRASHNTSCASCGMPLCSVLLLVVSTWGNLPVVSFKLTCTE
jgi:hypothetical protein